MSNFRTGLVAAGLLTCLSAQVFAQGTMTLRVADSLPAGFPQTEYSTIYWMKKVSEATNGQVKFEHFPAEQLGKARDLMSLTASGVVDVGYIVPAFVSDKLPLEAVAELPGSFATTCEGVKAYWKLLKDGILAKRDLEPNGLKAVFAVLNPPYQVWTREKKITSLEDFSGLKLRAASGGQALIVKQLRAAPIAMSGPDLYEALSRGTVDGALFPVTGIVGYDLGPLVKHAVSGENFGDVVTFHAMKLDAWKALPENVRIAMTNAGDDATAHACEMLEIDVDKNIKTLKSAGVTFTPLTDDARNALKAIQLDVAKQWAKGVDARGLPGTEVLQAFRDALK